ncbi:MAG TPA: hypothetical protein VGF29_06735 [Hyphomicrobiaceae bacterium]|jgi:hypothetical protein
MRYDGDPIWTHDEACSLEQLCARCEEDEQARMALAYEAHAVAEAEARAREAA